MSVNATIIAPEAVTRKELSDRLTVSDVQAAVQLILDSLSLEIRKQAEHVAATSGLPVSAIQVVLLGELDRQNKSLEDALQGAAIVDGMDDRTIGSARSLTSNVGFSFPSGPDAHAIADVIRAGGVDGRIPMGWRSDYSLPITAMLGSDNADV